MNKYQQKELVNQLSISLKAITTLNQSYLALVHRKNSSTEAAETLRQLIAKQVKEILINLYENTNKYAK